MKHALILSGSGARFSFFTGVVDYLTSVKSNDFDIIAGVSGGAIVGAMVAQNKMIKLINFTSEIEQDYKSIHDSPYFNENGHISFSKVISHNFQKIPLLKMIGSLFSQKKKEEILQLILQPNYLVDNSALKNKMRELIKLSDFPENKRFMTGFVSENTGKFHWTSNVGVADDESLINAILASASYPVFWPSVKEFRGIKNLIDGGIHSVTPLNMVIKYAKTHYHNEEVTLTIVNSHHTIRYDNEERNLVQRASRAFELMTGFNMQKDIDHFIDLNSHPDFKYFPYRIIAPEKPLNPVWDFSREALQENYLDGIEAVKKNYKFSE